MKLARIILGIGVIAFFPFPIEGSSCLFGYLSGLCSTAVQDETSLLTNYMHGFVWLWWSTISSLAYVQYRMRKRVNTDLDVHFHQNM